MIDNLAIPVIKNISTSFAFELEDVPIFQVCGRKPFTTCGLLQRGNGGNVRFVVTRQERDGGRNRAKQTNIQFTYNYASTVDRTNANQKKQLNVQGPLMLHRDHACYR